VKLFRPSIRFPSSEFIKVDDRHGALWLALRNLCRDFLSVVTPKIWTTMELPYKRSKGGESRMTHRRQFTAEFTAQVVLELLSGAKSSAELCREHQLASSVRADWKAHFLARAASLFKSPDRRDHQDATRVAELERVVGRLALENDILQKATNLLHSHAKRAGDCADAQPTLSGPPALPGAQVLTEQPL
jgi:transposase